MKYVIDASIAFKWEITEPLSDKAQKLRDDFRNAVHELLVPDLFPLQRSPMPSWWPSDGGAFSPDKAPFCWRTSSPPSRQSTPRYRISSPGLTPSPSGRRRASTIACTSL